MDHLADCFGLQEIYSAVQEGPPGKLSGFSQATPFIEQHFQNMLNNNRSAVAAEFNHIFHGEGVRGAEDQRNHLVYQPFSVMHGAEMGGISL